MNKLKRSCLIIEHDNGDKIKIIPSFYYSEYRYEYTWGYMQQILKAKKRKWVDDDSSATKDEILKAQTMLWESLKPAEQS